MSDHTPPPQPLAALLREPPPLPDGAAKMRIFDDKTSGFIAEVRRSGTTFHLRYTDQRLRRGIGV